MLDLFWKIQEYVYEIDYGKNLISVLVDRSDYPFTKIYLNGFGWFGDKLSICLFKNTVEMIDNEMLEEIKDKIDKCLPSFYLGV